MSVFQTEKHPSTFPLSSARIRYLEKRLQRRVKRFDLIALLKLLKYLGYEDEAIYFQSNPTLSSASSLCEEIFFIEGRVVIVVNLGLLGGNSPLPSFFRKKIDQGSIDSPLFIRFLGFFDHFTIKNFLEMSYPETSLDFFANQTQRQREYLGLTGLSSISTLSHLCSLCFPEFKVQVSKCKREKETNNPIAVLGATRLGIDLALGKGRGGTVSGFQITLQIDSIGEDPVIFWSETILTRMKELLFPLFTKIQMHLNLLLVIRKYQEQAFLSSSRSHLGYTRLGKSDSPLQIFLFSGHFS